MTVVRFVNFDIGVVTHHFRGRVQQFQAQIDAGAEVGRNAQRNSLSISFQLSSLLGAETRRSHHQPQPLPRTQGRVLQGGSGSAEIDEDIELLTNSGEIGAQGNAQGAYSSQLSYINPLQTAAGVADSGGQLSACVRREGFNQSLAHAA